MQVEEALRRFVVQLDADGRSPHTRRQYERHIRALARWLRESDRSTHLRDVDHETVALFLASPSARNTPRGAVKKAASANALRTSLRCFFAYARDAGYVDQNAARLVRRAQCGTPPPRALSEDDQQRLMDALTVAQGPEARRDHMLFHLMLATGIRLGSALALDRDDVDLERGELTLRRVKGDRREVVFLGRAIRDHLCGFLAGRTGGPLFTGRDGCAISARHVQRRLAMWLERAGIARPYSPHALRHSFATRLYRETGDIVLVQAALTHRSIASTLVYAKADERRLRAALAR